MVKVWVNGSFDVLHIGHIKLLEYAHTFGSVRVGLDTDERIKERKGNDRPFNSLSDRIEFLKSIKFVDSVVSFNTDDELTQKIIEYSPDIMVIGDDYIIETIVGGKYIPKIIFFPKIKNKSTSNILGYGKTNSLPGL